MGASPKKKVSYDALEEMKKRIAAKESIRNSLDRKDKLRLAIMLVMSLIFVLSVFGLAVLKSTSEITATATVAPTAAPLTTTPAWRPWPNTPYELYAYYHCGVNPALSLANVTPDKNAKVTDWPMLVTVTRASCGGGASCNLTLESTVVTNVCMGVAVDSRTIWARASCLQPNGRENLQNYPLATDEDNFYVITGQNLELTTLKENSLLAIESLWPSSQYNTTMDFSNFQQNDLLILRTKIDMTDFVPACIPDLQQDANAAGQVPKKCWFIGLNGYGGAFQVPATMLGDSECNDNFILNNKLDFTNQFCAKAISDFDKIACGKDFIFACDYETQFGDRKLVAFGNMIYHPFQDCTHLDNIFIFNRFAYEYEMLCCGQTEEPKYGPCIYVNCTEQPLSYP
ncbi:Oidioi.mRNA.OKI2018_I69.PAR.g8976.t1.cds [Oikopleura dioica]|uniref:Oidioi.mRNA.OKI2018_I69.PAR.g8976.t1.cds n=1 Tax=Oikopleura dioica TaxID=34765 RepID=A0ABN7RIH6_OIKDI|nr:Oidioi.mRNA.OKI2018_I69.PAR.g8976.t1.cds [Oikopleura dioica]